MKLNRNEWKTKQTNILPIFWPLPPEMWTPTSHAVFDDWRTTKLKPNRKDSWTCQLDKIEPKLRKQSRDQSQSLSPACGSQPLCFPNRLGSSFLLDLFTISPWLRDTTVPVADLAQKLGRRSVYRANAFEEDRFARDREELGDGQKRGSWNPPRNTHQLRTPAERRVPSVWVWTFCSNVRISEPVTQLVASSRETGHSVGVIRNEFFYIIKTSHRVIRIARGFNHPDFTPWMEENSASDCMSMKEHDTFYPLMDTFNRYQFITEMVWRYI